MQIDADLVEMVWGVTTKFATPEVERPSQAKRRRRLANKRSAVESQGSIDVVGLSYVFTPIGLTNVKCLRGRGAYQSISLSVLACAWLGRHPRRRRRKPIGEQGSIDDNNLLRWLGVVSKPSHKCNLINVRLGIMDPCFACRLTPSLRLAGLRQTGKTDGGVVG